MEVTALGLRSHARSSRDLKLLARTVQPQEPTRELDATPADSPAFVSLRTWHSAPLVARGDQPSTSSIKANFGGTKSVPVTMSIKMSLAEPPLVSRVGMTGLSCTIAPYV